MSHTVLITGAAGGLGREMAMQLFKAGHELILLDRTDAELAELKSSFALGAQVSCYATDLFDLEGFEKKLQEISAKHPRIDVVIGNAGIDQPQNIDNPDWRVLDRHLRINTTANAVLLSVFLPLWTKKNVHGHFGWVASLAALKGFPKEGPYCASKAALKSYMESIRAAIKDTPITMTTVFPGFINTVMLQRNVFKKSSITTVPVAVKKILHAILTGRRELYFPLSSRIGISFLNHLPAFAADRLIGIAMEQPGQKQLKSERA